MGSSQNRKEAVTMRCNPSFGEQGGVSVEKRTKGSSEDPGEERKGRESQVTCFCFSLLQDVMHRH